MVQRASWRRLIFVAAVAGLGAVVGWQVWFPGQAFDPDEWRDGVRVADRVRNRMADRLVARGTLIGKTRAEVVEMLGEPLPPRAWGGSDTLTYRLGQERSMFPIDSEWLSAQMGSDGRVVRCWVWTD